ncbi:FAD-dependent oxidoreductase [bacterium]|nr:FAD-dependent oxidoreductase [bacterium]
MSQRVGNLMRPTRRQFVAGGLSIAAAHLAHSSETVLTDDVLVIGAGLAGLACAKTLRDAGRRVRVVEARTRLGGRIWTDRPWNGFPIEMGARWIHGEKNNPIAHLAEKLGLKTIPTDFDSLEGFDPHGKRYTLNQIADGFLDEQRFEKHLEKNAGGRFRPQDQKSVADVLAHWPLLLEMSEQRAELFRLALRSELTLDYGADLDQLAWPGFDHDRPFPGRDLTIEQGYDRIVEHLASGLTIDRGVVVEEIDSTAEPIVVRTKVGSRRAHQVVVTVPLGVLQQGQIQFKPGLPPEKRTAIRSLGMGHVSKIAIRFSRLFWPKREILLFARDMGMSLEAYHLGLWNNQPVLQTYQAGTEALLEEKSSDDERIKRIVATLRRAFPTELIEPVDHHATNWSTDPFSRGAYSYVKVGSTPLQRDDLALPIDGKIFFAGEATHSDHPATVHGAYLSGVREARRILQSR